MARIVVTPAIAAAVVFRLEPAAQQVSGLSAPAAIAVVVVEDVLRIIGCPTYIPTLSRNEHGVVASTVEPGPG